MQILGSFAREIGESTLKVLRILRYPLKYALAFNKYV